MTLRANRSDGIIPSTVQWLECDTTGANCTDILGATGVTYDESGFAGDSIRVNADGTTSGPWYAAAATNNGISLPARMPESSGASVIHVSPAGSDTAAGTLGAPVKTLTKALSLASSGTIIYARGNAGPFTTQITFNKTFSASNPVTITTYPGDTRAHFAGPTSMPSSHTNGTYFGDVTGVRIRNVKFAAPFGVTGLKLDTVTDFEVDNCIIGPNGNSGVTAPVGAQGVLVGSTSATYTTRTQRLQMWNNTVFDWVDGTNPGHGHGFYLATLRNSVFANNVIYNTVGGGGYGIQLGASANGNIIVNNTIDGVTQSGAGGSAMVIWTSNTEGSPPTSGNLILNNLFTNNDRWGIEGCGQTPSPLNYLHHNLTHGNPSGAYRPIGCGGTGSGTFTVQAPNYTGDPLYNNRGAKDFRLQGGSPALAIAVPAYAPPRDKNGNVRPANPALGAYEQV